MPSSQGSNAPVSNPEANLVERIMRRDARRAVRASFYGFLAGFILALVTPGLLSVLPFFSYPSYVWLTLLPLGLFAVAYSGIVYNRFEKTSTRVMARHSYILAVFGFFLVITPAILFGSLAYGSAGYGMASVGYWLRHSLGKNPPKCPRRDGEVLVFGGESLLCSKCKKLLRVGYDSPRQWGIFGIAAVVVGGVLLSLERSIPGAWLAVVALPVGWLFIVGLVITIARFVQPFPRGQVRTSE